MYGYGVPEVVGQPAKLDAIDFFTKSLVILPTNEVLIMYVKLSGLPRSMLYQTKFTSFDTITWFI